MSEVKKPFLTKQNKIIIMIISVIIPVCVGMIIILEYDSTPNQKESAEEVLDPYKVMYYKEIDKEVFDKCTDMLIILVGLTSVMDGEPMEVLEQSLYDNVMFNYKELECLEIEHETSQTQKYKNRNSPDAPKIPISEYLD